MANTVGAADENDPLDEAYDSSPVLCLKHRKRLLTRVS